MIPHFQTNEHEETSDGAWHAQCGGAAFTILQHTDTGPLRKLRFGVEHPCHRLSPATFLISLTSKFQKGRQDLYQLKFDNKILLHANRTEQGYQVMKDVIAALQDNKVLDECCCSFEIEN